MIHPAIRGQCYWGRKKKKKKYMKINNSDGTVPLSI